MDRDYLNDVNHHHEHEDHHHHHRRHHSHHFHPPPPNDFNPEPDGSIAGDAASGGSFPLPGRKRQFSHSNQGTSPDSVDGGSFVKLYIAGIPRTATEEDIRSLFKEYGKVAEVILVRDKRTGQQHEYCFVKYAMLEEADRAIGVLNSQYTFPGGAIPIKVRFADGERERLGAINEHVYKLYVGNLNKQATKMEIDEIFSPYGQLEDIFIVRDELRQSRGCAFVQFSQREKAIAAINALHGTHVMRGCDQPLIVRFADPKKPRTGDSRGYSKFAVQGFAPFPQESGVRPAPYPSDPVDGHILPNDLRPSSPKESLLTGREPQITSMSAALESLQPLVEFSSSAVLMDTEITDSLDCDWSEHVCPDGYNYYYNCVTCESRWEKPEEYIFYEQQIQQQQQQHQPHHPPCQQPQDISNQQVSQMQHEQLEIQPLHQIPQEPGLSTQEFDNVRMQAATSPLVAPACV